MESPKYFAVGLELGLVDGAQVQNWVNEQIRSTESPPDDILDLAYIDSSDVNKLYSKLLSIPDARDQYDVLRDLLANVTDSQLQDLE